MDRFIVRFKAVTAIMMNYLKSNMDRFIVSVLSLSTVLISYLKSNMDRFIANGITQFIYFR